MWQELRRQERAIKCSLVDLRKRAERRKLFYSSMRQDPIKFLRCYGRPMKIHVDDETIKAASNPKNLTHWQADKSVIIDRFDARSHLDYFPDCPNTESEKTTLSRLEDRLLNYERYRCLVHNSYLGISEHFCLKQIEWDEKYGKESEEKKSKKEIDKKKILQDTKVAIGYNYEDDSNQYVDYLSGLLTNTNKTPSDLNAEADEDNDDDDDEPDSDMDIDVDVDFSQLDKEKRREICLIAHSHNIKKSDYIRLLQADQIIENELKLAKAFEVEKCSSRKPKKKLAKGRRIRYRDRNDRGGLIGSQPIKKRVIYLSASSSDSADYPSPNDSESDDPTEAERIEFMSNARPTFCRESKDRVSIIIGGLSRVSLANSDKLRRYNYDELDIKSATGSLNGKKRHKKRRNSSPREHSRHRRRSSSVSSYEKGRSKIEYITTFGQSDEEKPSKNSHRNNSRSYRSTGNLAKSSTRKVSSRQRSPSTSSDEMEKPKVEVAVPVRRYYRPELERDPSKELTPDSDSNSNESTRKTSSLSKIPSSSSQPSGPSKAHGSRFTPQELMRKRMQMQLNLTHQKDKIEEERKKERQREERIYRERELREVALKRSGLKTGSQMATLSRGISSSSSSSTSSKSSSPPLKRNTYSSRKNYRKPSPVSSRNRTRRRSTSSSSSSTSKTSSSSASKSSSSGHRAQKNKNNNRHSSNRKSRSSYNGRNPSRS